MRVSNTCQEDGFWNLYLITTVLFGFFLSLAAWRVVSEKVEDRFSKIDRNYATSLRCNKDLSGFINTLSKGVPSCLSPRSDYAANGRSARDRNPANCYLEEVARGQPADSEKKEMNFCDPGVP